MTPDEFVEVLGQSRSVLRAVVNEDWSIQAGTLEWACWQTVDHMIDRVF